MKRVLVLIHFANKLTRENMVTTGARVAPCVMSRLEERAAVLSSDIAFGFTGVTSMDCSDLLKTLVKDIGLKTGDNISVVEVGDVVISTHPGLMQWQGATQTVAYLARSAGGRWAARRTRKLPASTAHWPRASACCRSN